MSAIQCGCGQSTNCLGSRCYCNIMGSPCTEECGCGDFCENIPIADTTSTTRSGQSIVSVSLAQHALSIIHVVEHQTKRDAVESKDIGLLDIVCLSIQYYSGALTRMSCIGIATVLLVRVYVS